jgi:hypothetical protein
MLLHLLNSLTDVRRYQQFLLHSCSSSVSVVIIDKLRWKRAVSSSYGTLFVLPSTSKLSQGMRVNLFKHHWSNGLPFSKRSNKVIKCLILLHPSSLCRNSVLLMEIHNSSWTYWIRMPKTLVSVRWCMSQRSSLTTGSLLWHSMLWVDSILNHANYG